LLYVVKLLLINLLFLFKELLILGLILSLKLIEILLGQDTDWSRAPLELLQALDTSELAEWLTKDVIETDWFVSLVQRWTLDTPEAEVAASLVPSWFELGLVDVMTTSFLEFVFLLLRSEFVQLTTSGLLSLGGCRCRCGSSKGLLLNADHVERNGVFAAFVFENVENISCTWPLEAHYFFTGEEPNGLSHETLNGVIQHFINVNTVSLSIKSVVLLACLKLTLSQSVNCKLVVVRLPDDTIEFDDFTIDGDVLMREALLFGVEKFNWVLGSLLILVLVHYTQVISLRMEVELETLSIIKGLNSGLAGRNLDKSDTGMLVLPWESGVNKTVAVGSPHNLLDAFDSNTLFGTISSGNQFHGRKRVHTNTSLDLGCTVVLGHILRELLRKIVAIVRPSVDIAIFTFLLVEVSNLLN